ncbi:efflux RND transporter periplasmic adaptor subunit [Alienimonas sp. DA493]|uniref:efflux RND transporter periplasmic adaptor subunit n=1 Tax=Alienimonas sp. DA493 TaxID=3373605 RepID=UPI0037544726
MAIAAVPVAAVALWLSAGWWLPELSALAFGTDPTGDMTEVSGDPHAGHDHGVAAAGEVIRLSDQARGTIGLRTATVELTDFDRTITVPGVVAERPGRSKLQVSAPMTGVVTDVFATEGQAVRPGDTLFLMRLTHEDVVQAQTDYLKTLEALDVEEREIDRLQTVSRGVVAGKVVLERQYEKQKLEGLLKAQRQRLLLHGLGESQVARIASDRDLVREIRIVVPDPHDPNEEGHGEVHDPAVRDATPTAPARTASLQEPASQAHPPLTVERLNVHAGDAVDANAPLAELSDLSLLYVEGRAFERDAAAVVAAAREDRPVTALPTDNLAGASDPVTGLEIAYVANRVGADSRVLPFYVLLPNEIVSDARAGREDARFLTWKYKPGQRMRLRVPVETYAEAIVLPIEAVAEAGAERFAFVENGATFERRPVHVVYRDAESVVVADDGSLLPGESVAVSAAHQLQMALKNAAGGAIDPHAGHNH